MVRDLVWLACRYHVFEIMLSKVFTLYFGPSSSLEIPLFKRLRDVWDTFPKEHYGCLDFSTSTEQFIENSVKVLRLF